MTTNIQSFAGDVQIDSGNLSVKSLEVKDGVTKLGSNNTAYSNVGVMMTRKDGASNVAFLFTEDGANVVLGYTNDDALEGDRIDILQDEKANLVVYGNVYVTGSVHGDGSTLTGLVTTLQSVTNFGSETDQTLTLTNATTGMEVTSNIVVDGNVTALTFIGDGSQLDGIATTLEEIVINGNTTSNVVEFLNATSLVTSGNVGISNLSPHAGDLCVGANVVIDDEKLDKISVTGNVAAHQLNLGSVEILPAYSLENVTAIANLTTNTMSFKNTTLAFDTDRMAGIGIIPSSADVGVSGLHVDGHLRLGGAADNTDEEQMYVKAAGALGILANESDTDNTNTALRLQTGDTNNSNITMIGKSSAQYMTFGTNAAERMRITADGKVGVGTSAPGAPLEVAAPEIDSSDPVGTTQVISRFHASDGVLNIFARQEAYGEETIGLQTQIDGRQYADDVAGGWAYATEARHKLLLQPHRGRVGIGLTNPSRPLTVESSEFCLLNLKRTSAGDGATLEIVNGDDDKWTVGTDGTGTFGIYNGATFGEQFTIDTNGNVGIGTAAPSANLHVVGNAYVSSNLTVDTSTLHVDATTNRVGVGTTNPQGALHISSGTSGDAHLIIEADTDNNNESDNPKIVFRQDGGFYAGELGLENNHMVFRSKSSLLNNTGFVFYSNVSPDGEDGLSKTDINDIEDTQVEVMRIGGDGTLTVNGSVGIATDPLYKLDVYNGTSGNDALVNPAIDNDIILFDDQNSATTFNGTVYGNATRDTSSGYIQLTPNSLGQTGWVTWPCQLPNSWTCEFDMWRGDVAYGADQIHFVFYHDNASSDPNSSDHFRITTNEYGQDTISLISRVSGTYTTLDSANLDYLSATYQKCVVNYDRGSLTVSVDGVKYIDYKIAETARLYSGKYVSFRGNTGSVSTEHRVRNIRITKGNKWVYSDINSSGNICYLNGRVGIGTTSADEQLHIRTTSGSSSTQLLIENTNQSRRAGLSIINSDREYFNIQHIGGATASSNVAIIENFSRINGGMQFFAKGDGEYIFKTTDSNSTRFLITNDGDVAIGAITPSSKLHVDGDVRMKTLSTNAIGKITPVYVRGTGANNGGNRIVRIGDTTHVNTGTRGLTLTIINASTHAHVSSTNYDTYGSTTESNNLATALEAMTDAQIGILSSQDAFEDDMTTNLITALFKLGLTRLAGAWDDLNRHPYCAIFYGPGASGVPGNHAIEVMKSDDASGAYATLSTFLVDDSFIGQTVTNALYSGTADVTTPTIMVDRNQRVGIGTTNPGAFLVRMWGGTPNSSYASGSGYLSLGNTNTNPTTRIENAVYGEPTYINEAGSTAVYGTNVRFQPGQMYGGAMWATAGYAEPTLYGSDNIIYGGDINASGNDGTGAGQYHAGNTYIGAGVAWVGNTVGESGRTYNGKIFFQTGVNDDTSSTDTNRYNRAAITPAGHFGIGTDSPSDEIHMYHSDNDQIQRFQQGNYNSYLKATYNDFQIQAIGDTGRYGQVKFFTGNINGSASNKVNISNQDANCDFFCLGKASIGTVENRGFDFIFGNGDQSSRGDSGNSRALVKNAGEVLQINYADDFEGGVYIQGSVSKDSGSFKISHPLPEKKDTHYLVHSFIEGPQADNIYRGVVELSDGRAEVNIDTAARMTEGTFVALNRRTQCFTTNETDWDAVKGRVVGNILTIECQNAASTANVSWMVIGERQDEHMYETRWTDDDGRVITEPEKPFMYDETLYDHLIPQDPANEEYQISESIAWPDMPDALEIPAEPIAYPSPSAPVVSEENVAQ